MTQHDELAERVARRIQTSQIQGPYLDIDERRVVVWCFTEVYGRVHHAVNSIKDAERAMDQANQRVRKAFGSLEDDGIFWEQMDVSCDGMKGGRNRMIFEQVFRSSSGPWDADLVEDNMPSGYKIKDMP